MREALKTNASSDEESATILERTVSVCYGANFVDVSFTNFVAPSIAKAQEWSKGLLAIIGNQLDINSSPLRSLERL